MFHTTMFEQPFRIFQFAKPFKKEPIQNPLTKKNQTDKYKQFYKKHCAKHTK